MLGTGRNPCRGRRISARAPTADRAGETDVGRDPPPTSVDGVVPSKLEAALSEVLLMAQSYVHRPRLTVRLGVTGTRTILDDARVRERVETIVSAVVASLKRLATDPIVAAVYDVAQPPLLRLISPLAEGADRLVAEVALAYGAALDVITPFPISAYEKDFPESSSEFHSLVKRADGRVLECDGERHDEIEALAAHDPRRRLLLDERNRAYESVGHMVVRNSDLIVAVWDRLPAEGRGGTGDVVRYAAIVGPPVVRIAPDGRGEPEWIFDVADFHRSPTAKSRQADVPIGERIDTHLTEIATPPASVPEERGFVARWLCAPRDKDDPLKTFLEERRQPRRFRWRLYDEVIRLFAGRTTPSERKPAATVPRPDDPTWRHWQAIQTPADELAVVFADRYRTAAVASFALAAVALTSAGFGLFHHHLVVTGVEFVALVLIFLFFCANLGGRWHRRFVAYRLLAELARNQQALALVGNSLAIDATTRATGGIDAGKAEKETWVGWYFQAMLRNSPLPTGSAGEALPTVVRSVRAHLLDDQHDYHERNAKRCLAAADHMEFWSTLFFVVTIVLVVVEAIFGWTAIEHEIGGGSALPDCGGHLGAFLGFLTVAAPSISAALFGILSFAELKVHADQSARMATIMADASERFAAMTASSPDDAAEPGSKGSLRSRDFAMELQHVAMEMLEDIAGWSRLSRVKSLGLG